MVTLLLLLLVAAALALLWSQQRRQVGARRASPALARSLFDLQPGDVVQAHDRDWVVEERLQYDQDGFIWFDHLLRDGELRRWLAVCEDDELELSWWEEIDPGEIDPGEIEPVASDPQALPARLGTALGAAGPFPSSCRWRGVTHRRREWGEALVTAAARRLPHRPGLCRFADYEAADGALLCLEVWGKAAQGQELEASAGHRLDPLDLRLLPGDGRSVYRPA
ncbi:MAG: DUF4178 domain-containing protein [Synechococcus sp.]|nr:DUF4178 domain-containing protein [Synechococcus sp.]